MKTLPFLLLSSTLIILQMKTLAINYDQDLGTLNSGSTITRSGSTIGMGNRYGNSSADVIFRIYIPSSTTLNLNTCGSNFDTYLHLLNSVDTRIAYDDDSAPCGGYASYINYPVSAGYYFIIVEGFSSQEGSYVLNVSSQAVTLPSLTVSSPNVNENAGSAVFTISLNQTSAATVSGYFSTSNNSAVAGSDYTPMTGTFIISAGSLSTSVSIPILDDAVSESTENFYLTISSPTNATIANGTGICTINDNDVSLPALSINSPTVNENSGSVLFTVSLNRTYSAAVSGNFSTSNNTAISGSDYTATSGIFSIPAGALNTTISIQILDDAISESSESFYLTISNPVNATIAAATGICTISDNDTGGSVTSVNGLTGAVIIGLTNSVSGTSRTINITNGTGTTIDIADNDNSATNELQTLSVSGNLLTISGGNTVTLPSSGGGSSQWTTNANSSIQYTGGNVGIGNSSTLRNLSVFGNVYAKEVLVSLTVPAPDYVFDEKYKLFSFGQLRNFIETNRHLPGIPSAREMETNGIGVSEMNMLLLKKIEEMSLYILQLEKRVKEVEEQLPAGK